MRFLSLLILTFALPVLGGTQTSITTEQNYCSLDDNQNELSKLQNRLSFRNAGGLANGGVCWWHSRFTRNANMLAYFSPEKARPQDIYINKRVRRSNGKGTRLVQIPAPGSIQDIIRKIKNGDEVVEIPGFSNLHEFSSYYQNEIQSLLENWQLEDGLIKQKWIVGLMGKNRVDPRKLKNMMDDAYKRSSRGDVVYQKLQIKGIDAHAWLIQKMEKTSNGYKLFVIDSNYHEIQVYNYKFGDDSFYHTYYGHFVPYTENSRELKKIHNTKTKYCLAKSLESRKKRSAASLDNDSRSSKLQSSGLENISLSFKRSSAISK